MDNILFGGYTTTAVLPGNAPPFKKKEGISNIYDILEQGFVQLTSKPGYREKYGDPEKGATLEQAWRTAGILTGKWPVCLLATGRPNVPSADIATLIKVNPGQMVAVFKSVFVLGPGVAITVLYFDGKTGHTICLLSYDAQTSRFTFLDPWPEFSLLSKEWNLANVDAQRVREQVWSLTDEELERVVFASFIAQNYWAAYNGRSFGLRFPELEKSDFWNFFHVTIMDASIENEVVHYALKTGGFQSEVDVLVKTNKRDEIIESRLLINRAWLLGPPYGINPLALDIIRSFMATTMSPADEATTRPLLSLFEVENVQQHLKNLRGQPGTPLNDHKLLDVYLGITEQHRVPMVFSELDVSNVQVNQADRFVITTSIDTII